MKILIEAVQNLVREALEAEVEDQIVALMDEPEFVDVDAFIAAKLEDEDYEYSFVELQALARNATAENRNLDRDEVSQASISEIENVKKALNDMGFKFIGRAPARKVRGFKSSYHGTHPFAGSGGGGSGFGSGFNGPSHTSFGGGPGAIGGGYTWDPKDPKNLNMGAKRRK